MTTPDTEKNGRSLPPHHARISASETVLSEEGEVCSIAVENAVEFSQKIARSSLGSDTAREHRLIGRQALSDFESDLVRYSQDEPQDLEVSIERAAQQDFDAQVARELERRGSTFEAELRYQSIVPPAPLPLGSERIAVIAKRLGRLLESKGFRQQALQMYARAANAADADSLWRLAVVSARAGRRDWAMTLAERAKRAMTSDGRKELDHSLRVLSRSRTSLELGHLLDGVGSGHETVDATYALGSSLLVLSGRIDLARLAYSSALARGNSLAAVSLLDLPAREADLVSRATLGSVVTSLHATDSELQVAAPPQPGGRFAEALRSGVASQRLNCLLKDAGSTRNVTIRRSAIQSILVTARTVTALRGYTQVGHNAVAVKLISKANDETCRQLRKDIESQAFEDTTALVKRIWTTGTEQLENARKERDSYPMVTATGAGRSGTVLRFKHALSELSSDEQQIMVLRLAGISPAEAAAAVGLESTGTGRIMFRRGSGVLRTGQRGEQFDAELWREVEKCFSSLPPDVRRLFDRLQEMDPEG